MMTRRRLVLLVNLTICCWMVLATIGLLFLLTIVSVGRLTDSPVYGLIAALAAVVPCAVFLGGKLCRTIQSFRESFTSSEHDLVQ